MLNFKKHNNNLYNTALNLSRNLFFYKKLGLKDTFETRIYLMFIHFSILMIVFKKKKSKFDQESYDNFFHSIENNLRELGFGDVTVNKKMKDFNKILYDILLKLDLSRENGKNFLLNMDLIKKYFESLNTKETSNLSHFVDYINNFFNFCFELPLDNMLDKANNFKY
tara:strand:+ start:18 stop:518 length:501 start_codon:yes stop_codon:yes gene_type:complete